MVIEATAAAEDQAANLSRAYRVNLTMLAAMALLTGGFLVFSAQALSVVRRRTEFAFLRAIGLTRAQLFVWLVAEGALVGLAGGLVGVVARARPRLADADAARRRSRRGLFPRAHSRNCVIQPLATAIYVVLGMLAGAIGAWLPAREAATVSPAQALKAGDEVALLGGRGHPRLGLAMLFGSLAACLHSAARRPAARRLSGDRLPARRQRHAVAAARGDRRRAAAAARAGAGATGRAPASPPRRDMRWWRRPAC